MTELTPEQRIDEILDNNATYIEDYPGGKVIKVKPEAKQQLLSLLEEENIKLLESFVNVLIKKDVFDKDFEVKSLIKILRDILQVFKQPSNQLTNRR